jgi:malate permease and related proteins
LFVGSTLIFAALGLLFGVYFVLSGFHSRGFALPILFMNAGNMGIPFALLAFGPAAMQRATLLYVFIAFLQYSLGIYILNGRANWIEIFRLPLIYASIGGVYFNLMHIRIPEALAQPN